MSIVSVFSKRFHRKKRNGDSALAVDHSRTGHNITAYFHRRISELPLIVDRVHVCKEHITFGGFGIHIYHEKIAGFFKRLARHNESERRGVFFNCVRNAVKRCLVAGFAFDIAHIAPE